MEVTQHENMIYMNLQGQNPIVALKLIANRIMENTGIQTQTNFGYEFNDQKIPMLCMLGDYLHMKKCDNSETWKINSTHYQQKMIETTKKSFIQHSLPNLIELAIQELNDQQSGVESKLN